MTKLISPYGGELADLMAEGAHLEELLREAATLPALILNTRQLCDLELLLNGALSPLHGFMGRADFDRSLSDMLLADGTFWPIPIALDVGEEQASSLQAGNRVVLCDVAGNRLAVLAVSDIWKADRELEARQIYGDEQPVQAVHDYLARLGSHYVGGLLEGLALPSHEDFSALRLTPAMARKSFMRYGYKRVVAFQPCQVMHRAQYEFTLHCSEENEAALMIQAISHEKLNPDFFTRIRCLQALMPHYPENSTLLGLLPLTSRRAGIREVLWRAIVARNYGCTHFIIGGDAGPGDIRRGSDALVPGRIQPLAEHFATIGVEPITFPRMLYIPELGQYMPEEYLLPGQFALSMPAQELQQRISDGREAIPEWASFPEVVKELQIRRPQRTERGFVVFLARHGRVGRAGFAHALELKLMELTGRPVTLLNGDDTDSKAGPDQSIHRIGFVAAEITRHGGVTICELENPCRETGQKLRDLVEPLGGFIEVQLSSAQETGKARDAKGVYTRARAGRIDGVGADACDETQHVPELSIEMDASHVADAVDKIVRLLGVEGYLDVT